MDIFLSKLNWYIIKIWVDYGNVHGLYFNVIGGFWLLNRPSNGHFLTKVAMDIALKFKLITGMSMACISMS